MSKFRTVILTFALVLSFTLAVAAQAPSRIYRIGILTPIEPSRAEPATLPALVKALSELGFTEGQNLVIEQRGREGNVEELTHLARELIQTRPDVLVGVTSVPTKALLNTGTKTPIVFMFVSDPVGQGLVSSLAQPGGNVTGVTNNASDLAAKRFELLHEAVPNMSRLAVMFNPRAPPAVEMVKNTQSLAEARSVTVEPIPITQSDEIPSALDQVLRADALSVIPDLIFAAESQRIAEFAVAHRLPTIFGQAVMVRLGGLMAYGTGPSDQARKAAVLVDKILKGANPSELPVEQITKPHLVVNLKTARAIGLEIPTLILLLADEVIE